MNNIARFYMLNDVLSKRLRTGWLDVKITHNRIQSVSEHIYGCLILAISINSEYKLNMDMEKVLYMITLHELEEIILPDYSFLAKITKEEKLELGYKAVKKVVSGLIDGESVEELLKEFNERKTDIAKFAYHVDKLEADFKAKVYDLEGCFDIEAEKEDARAWNKEHAEAIIASSTCASDIWIDNDHYLYEDDPIFSELQSSLKNITEEEFKNLFEFDIDNN